MSPFPFLFLLFLRGERERGKAGEPSHARRIWRHASKMMRNQNSRAPNTAMSEKAAGLALLPSRAKQRRDSEQASEAKRHQVFKSMQ